MPNKPFDFDRLAPEDHALAVAILGRYRLPDLTIAPDGGEYLYRWHMVRGADANVYFHIQVASDPERPLHDHPWDNTSVILAGGYREIINVEPDHDRPASVTHTLTRKKGDVIHRPATWAHRLILPDGVPYTMSIFTTGPKVRDWGFWFEGKFRPFQEITVETAGNSKWKGSMA